MENELMKADPINDLIKDLKGRGILKTKDISDSYHTIGELYNHRCILFSVICNQNKQLSWKARHHFNKYDDQKFKGMFIVGIKTPMGQATYHYNDEFWDLFRVNEIEKAPEWDGHDSFDVIRRLQSLEDR